ncbi:MAG TPA: hypothetical protein VGH52_01280 [Gaiellaceae bacterium]
MRVALAVSLVCLCAAVAAPLGGAAGECHGLQVCVPVHGPWVVTNRNVRTTFLLSCGKHGVVGGLDAVTTSSAVRVSFEGRIGAPVQPGVTTTTSAVFHGVGIGVPTASFQPWLGCVPASGGGGRSTVSARSRPGPSLDPHAKTLVVAPGSVKTMSVGCVEGERLIGGWDALAFRTVKAPDLANVKHVKIVRATAGGRVHITVSATDDLPIAAHAVVQVGAECAP